MSSLKPLPDDSELIPYTTYYHYLKPIDTYGNEGHSSDVASVVFGQLKLSIPDARGKTGEEVRLPINIANADDLSICGLDICITYDQTVLSAKKIERTPLSTAYAWAYNLETPGIAKAHIATSEAESLYGGGSLFYLIFDVIGEDSATSTLDFQVSETSLYDCGENHTPVLVSLDLSDMGMFTVSDNYILGDLNGDAKVDSADVIMTLNISVGNTDPTKEQENAGDVSGDGRVRTNDAALILRIAADLPLTPEPSETRENGSSSKSSLVNVTIPDISISENGTMWIPIEVDDASKVVGAEIVLNYDSDIVTATDVQASTLTKDFSMESNLSQPGQVRIAISAGEGREPLEGDISLIQVQFTAQTDASGSSPLNLNSVRLNDTYGRDFATSVLQTDVNTTGGCLTVGKSGELQNAILALKMIAGMNPGCISSDADADRDGKICMEDAISILQALSGK